MTLTSGICVGFNNTIKRRIEMIILFLIPIALLVTAIVVRSKSNDITYERFNYIEHK